MTREVAQQQALEFQHQLEKRKEKTLWQKIKDWWNSL